jgi:hypothetical protein
MAETLASVRVSFPGAAALDAALAVRLGKKPRRMGLYTRLALCGAIDCAARVSALAPESALVIATTYPNWPELGPLITAFNTRAEPPLPFDFLAAQVNGACLAVANHLRLRGPALLVSTDPVALEPLTQVLLADAPAVFIGEVDMGDAEWVSDWRLLGHTAAASAR